MAERECGSCTLCCKVLGVQALDKPRGAWCPHCLPGRGCGIYSSRPEECRTFLCGWMLDANLGEEWKPQHSKIVLAAEPARIVAYVDPGTPEAWRKPHYFEVLDRMARTKLSQGMLVYVSVAGRYTLLLPGRQQELGLLADDDEVAVAAIARPGGVDYQVSVRKGSAASRSQPLGPNASSGAKRVL